MSTFMHGTALVKIAGFARAASRTLREGVTRSYKSRTLCLVAPAVRALFITFAIAISLGIMIGGDARADDNKFDPLAGLIIRNAPIICYDQTYALCAGSSCFVFNNVAYCNCDVKKGKSISSRFTYDGNKTICSLNKEGVDNGYMASTFSPPPELTSSSGTKALYACPRTSRADYAKCDGGLCFTSTTNKTSPGSNTPLGEHQIVCSCPVEKADPVHGLEIIGPYPCQKDFFKNCNEKVATNANGSTLYDGTSIGSTFTGTLLLTDRVPSLNTCHP